MLSGSSHWSRILRKALESHALVAVTDRDFLVDFASEGFCALSAADPENAVGRGLGAIHSGFASEALLCDIVERIERKTRWRGEVENRAPDGSTYWLDATISAFDDPDDRSGGFVVIATDFTGHKVDASELRSNLTLLNAVIENFPGGISYISRDLVLRSANKMFYRLLDLTEDRFPVGTDFADIIRYNAERGDYGEGDPDEMVRERIELAKKFEKHAFERRRPDGTSLEIRGFPLPEGGFVTTYVDVTERKKVEATNIRLARIVEDSINEVYVFDADTLKFLKVNHSASENLGYSLEELRQMTPVDLKPEYTFEDFENAIAPLRSGEKSHVRLRTVHRRKDRSQYHVDVTLQQIQADDGPVFAAIIEDITEKRRSENQIAYMAHHDALTDLANRTLLQQRLEAAVERARRGHRFAVLCLDLDRFKTINDTFGHAVGDDLLRTIAERLRNCVRRTDTVARLGGDEFAVIYSPCAAPRDATAIARRIGDAIRKPMIIKGHEVTVDSSIGIAVARDDKCDPDTLMHQADLAMYRAKSDGRGTYRFYEQELDGRQQARSQLALDVAAGLQNGEFVLRYQPIVNIEDNQITAFEALLRWRHPRHGLMSPADFISVAEETGHIRRLGDWILRQACADAAHWPKEVRVAVNLSPIQFNNQNLSLKIARVLAERNFPATRLDLEITETVLMRDTEETLVTLHQLRDFGARICMDDFGSGYSSLDYLRKFRFDRIKIDRFFVKDLTTDDDANAIVHAIASLGARLGISVVAEGVETKEQLEIVRAEGCREMQGFLFSPPISFGEVMRRYFPETEKTTTVA